MALELSKTKLVASGRFAQRDANNGGKRRPETIYFLGYTLYCARNRKGNFQVGMRTEKSRFRRSINRLQDLMRRQRHLPMPEQAANQIKARLPLVRPRLLLPYRKLQEIAVL